MELLENLSEAIQKTIEEKCNNINEQDLKNANLSKNELEVAQKLGAIEEFTVDRIENEMIVLENRKTRKMENIEKNKFPQEIKEGDILKKINGKYFIDDVQTKEVSERIQNKMKQLWK